MTQHRLKATPQSIQVERLHTMRSALSSVAFVLFLIRLSKL